MAEISHDEKLRSLRGVSLFAGLSDELLGVVAAMLQAQTVAPGGRVFEKGDAGDSLYIVVDGRVRVHDGELIFNGLGPGDVFGEMALLDRAPRLASVTADVETRLYRLEQHDFDALFIRHAEVARGVIQALSRHLRARVADRTRDYSYIRQVEQITAAAAALQAGSYAAESLDEVAARGDALGNLARVFQRMASEVHAREQALKREVQALRIEIDRERQARQVAQITGSDFFQSLRQQAQALRDELGVDGDAPPG